MSFDMLALENFPTVRSLLAHSLVLLCVSIISVACSNTPQSATPSVSYSGASNASASGISSTPVTAASDLSQVVGDDSQQAESGSLLAASRPPTYPFTLPTLEERIFFADVIAVVRPISVEPSVLTLQLTPGQTDYSPVVQSRYEVLEYLKGDGDSEIVVDAKNIFDAHSSFEHALQTAQSQSAAQLSELGGGDVVVFLQRMEHNPDFILDASRKANETEWRRHNAQTGLFSAVGDVGDISTTFSAASVSAQDNEQSADFSIDELRARIVAMESLLREGKDIEGWEDCIASRFLQENYRRAQGDSLSSVFDVEPSPSGLPADSIVDKFDTTSHTQWFTGDSASLFHYGAYEITTTRPLPAGAYEVNSHFQDLEWVPCDYVPPPVIWRYNFESAAGTLHEAFFDPVDIGGAVGADGASGVLKPASFTFDGSDAAIERIAWRDGQVQLSLSPRISLADHHIDFIALDGSVALRLDFDDAVERVDDDDVATLAWGVCEQPWVDGDMLMLRISESPADLAGVTFNADCAPAAATASPTPEIVPVDTPVPTSMPAPTPTPKP